jgi:hypothetical protein
VIYITNWPVDFALPPLPAANQQPSCSPKMTANIAKLPELVR